MISTLHIENYKSLYDITLDVGRVNVFIGENGCGKSNLLEAITLIAAASANKLDNEFLVSRGVRVTEPKLMRSAFKDENLQKPIKVSFTIKSGTIEYTLTHDNEPYAKWTENRNNKSDKIVDENQNKFHSFIIYSPENSALRNFSKEGQIEPLGINGEGLFKLLKVIENKSEEQWQEIHDSLELFDWYDTLQLPKDLSLYESRVTITDRYLILPFDQRSANEGFLFILFYIALMVSDDTPKIFAIDNVDASLNPKLCTKLIKELVRLAKKYDKQVFVTAHNPAILDGIDLGDDEQRLFVVSRDNVGHTRFERMTIENKPRSSTGEPLKLSEAFLRGYLGGLPTGF